MLNVCFAALPLAVSSGPRNTQPDTRASEVSTAQTEINMCSFVTMLGLNVLGDRWFSSELSAVLKLILCRKTFPALVSDLLGSWSPGDRGDVINLV